MLEYDEGEEDECDVTLHSLRHPTLAGAQPGQLLGVAEASLNGVITSDKFCWSRYGQLRLAWSRRPMRLR